MPHPSAISAHPTAPEGVKPRGTFVRGSRRHEVSIRGLLSIAPASSGIVRWTSAAGARDGAIEVDVVDVGTGGLGAIGLVFLPRGTWVRVRLLAPTAESQVLLDVTGVVRRISMIDRRPAYQIGIGFQDVTPQTLKAIESLLGVLVDTEVDANTPGFKGAAHA